MKKLISVIVSLLIFLNITTTVLADQLNNANQSINENKEKLDDIQEEQKIVEKQLKDLENKMNQLTGEIKKLTAQINTTNEDVERLVGEIDAKLKEIEEQEELLDHRLLVMYKKGNIGFINIIFSSENFADMVDKAVYVERIISNDKQLIAKMEENKKQLEETRKDLENKKAELEKIKLDNSTKLAQLNSQSAEKKELMDKLSEDRESYLKLIEQEENDAEALKEKIKNLEYLRAKAEAEAKAKAEAEAKAKAEAEAKADGKSQGQEDDKKEDKDQGIVSKGKLYCVTGVPYRITSSYGTRFHPVLNTYRFHAGMDIGVYSGTPLYALKDGQVIFSGYMSGYGNVILIHHGDIISLYAHNSTLLVEEGQYVKGGQLIAKSGNSGVSTGPHCILK